MVFFIGNNAQGQTSNTSNIGLEAPVYYSADDSIIADVPNQIIRLYGNSKVNYEDIELTASIIEIDLKNKEVSAFYSLDSLGPPIGKPIFKEGTEEIKCNQLKYNFETKQGYITEIRTQQDEGYIHMEQSKIHANKEIHFLNGKYTTCEKDEPHYYFKLSKAMIVPNKRIVTGPMHMRILDIPLPIAAPFAVLPNSEDRTHGLVLSEMRFSLASLYGTGIERLGYYIPLGKNWETFFYGSIYTTGRWGLSNRTNYYKKYKAAGSFSLGYERLTGYFFDTIVTNNFNVNWRHVQDSKAHPSIKFNSDINFVSNNNPKQSLEQIADNYFQNQINSSITLTKNWRVNKFSGGWNIKNSLRQNVKAKTFTIDLPAFNFNISRFDLGVLRKQNIGKKWYENISITYALNSQNNIVMPDSILNPQYLSLINGYAKNGIKQNVILQTNLKPKNGIFNFNLSTTYNEYWNFQSYEKKWDTNTNNIDTTLIDGFATSRDVSFRGGLTSNLYGYFKSPNQKVKARHVMTPQISFSYRPDIGAHQSLQIDSIGNTEFYSPFDVSLYREPPKGESGLISFSVGNTLELKYRDKKDSVNETYKKLRLIDVFSIGGSYDIFKDSMNLSDFTFSLRTTPVKFINLQSSWRLSPYAWEDSTGLATPVYAWNDNKGIGRITTFSNTISARFKSKPKDNQKDSILVSKIEIPWTANFSYNIKFDRKQNGVVQKDTILIVQTIRWDGNIGLNGNWKLDYGVNVDIQTWEISSLNVGLWRNLHCWETGFSWRQVGHGKWGIDKNGLPYWERPTNYYLSVHINIKASMFNAFLPEQNIRIPNDWK